VKTMFVTEGPFITSPEISTSLAQRTKTENPLKMIYRAINGSTEQNLRKVIDLMREDEKIVGSHEDGLGFQLLEWL
jgi:hypothetical protein